MADRPIIMSGHSIPGILDGSKSQTRRIIKRQPSRTVCDHTFDAEIGEKVIWRGWPHYLRVSSGRNKRDAGELTPVRVRCPYGGPGDCLWVRESLHQEFTTEDADTPNGCLAIYSADGEVVQRNGRPAMYQWERTTLSARFMPRWASRIWLQITGVGVQRVREISESDAKAEGVHNAPTRWGPWRNGFRLLWDSVNAKRGYPWELNPWVWAISFKRLKP